jgi:hypothetical protein
MSSRTRWSGWENAGLPGGGPAGPGLPGVDLVTAGRYRESGHAMLTAACNPAGLPEVSRDPSSPEVTILYRIYLIFSGPADCRRYGPAGRAG